MSTVIDSKVTQLEPAQIITEFAGSYNSTEYPTEVVLASIMKEITMPDTDLVQFGNTAFIGHRGKGKDKHKMVGRGLTVDTAQNFVSAGFKFFDHLKELGITNYITQYDGPIYDKAFEVWKRQADKDNAGTKIAVGRLANGNSQAYVSLAKAT